MSVLASVRVERQSWTGAATESLAFRGSWVFKAARATVRGPNCLETCLEF